MFILMLFLDVAANYIFRFGKLFVKAQQLETATT